MKKRSWIKAFFFIVFSIFAVLCAGILILFYIGMSGLHIFSKSKEGQIKVACAGDSITYGHGVRNWAKNQYPVVLGKLLGEEYHVQNFGVSGANVQDDSDKPYSKEKTYQKSLSYNADKIVFMLGSNDAKPQNWHGKDAFKTELLALLDSYLTSEKKPTIYLCTPATAFYVEDRTDGTSNFDIQPAIVAEIAEIVREVAIERDYSMIDIHAYTADHPEWFFDAIHPNREGAAAIAELISKMIR